ncbi:MAG: aminotransferase class I/II-fold pyridoxal phosphate-dependent enzyme [Candidatus Obscuribacterales bacterium]|nr:aminotransferase class I/II-fold pyridoxal phosphate-dependent enzyme [Candidatus Obscuribacterales bacterium]
MLPNTAGLAGKISLRASEIRPSNIRDAARLVQETPGVVNLGQGLPEYPAPQCLKEAAAAALFADHNQYTNTWGLLQLRQAIADKMRHYNGLDANPEHEITVTCGASEALNVSLLSLINRGDEVIVFEPFYENYHPNVVIAGGVPRYVRLHAPDYTFDPDELRAAFNERTRAILINTPHNPTGRVFSREELTVIAELCQKWDVVAITDEIYEYMVYDGNRHISIATLPGMRDRTITISGLSKTFGITGWRLGYAVAPPTLSTALRKLHDYMTLAAPSPLQVAAITALKMPDSFYEEMCAKYKAQRDALMVVAREAGFQFRPPQGTYYLFTAASELGFANDRVLWHHLVTKFKLATVAGYCFHRPGVESNNIRFCYAKYPETIRAASERLAAFKASLSSAPVSTGGVPSTVSLAMAGS